MTANLLSRLQGLKARLNAGEISNELDIAIEIALFNPDVAVRANSAGTKVIYTKRDGSEVTHWAEDWSMDRNRARAIAILTALEARDGKD